MVTSQEFRMICVALFSSITLGCSGSTTKKWTEDVLLEDGSVITVKRSATYSEHNSWSGDVPGTDEGPQSIEFTGPHKNLHKWQESLMPLLLYQDNTHQQWVIVATSLSELKISTHGTPRSSYWEFRGGASDWKEVPLAALSIGKASNLFIGYQEKDMPKHVSYDRTRELLEYPPLDIHFKKISPP